DRVTEEVPKALGRVPHRETARTRSRKIPIPPHRHLRLHRQGMRGRELPDPLEEGSLGMVEAGPFEVIEDCALIRRGTAYDREQALDFGREGESHAVAGIVERLHAQAVSGATDAAAEPRPDGGRDHRVRTGD